MNRDQLKGKWKQLQGEVKAKWGKLTEDDWKVADGDVDRLVGRIQERYGDAKEVVRKQVDELLARLNGLGAAPTEPARSAAARPAKEVR